MPRLLNPDELSGAIALCGCGPHASALTEIVEHVKALTVERDAARANARILAHSYTHDSRPPRCVVADALAYPADPTKPEPRWLVRTKRTRRHTGGKRDGTVIEFDRDSCRGRVGFGDGEPVAFHSTSAGGHVYMLRWPAVGDPVTVVFSDDACTRLLSVEHRGDLT